MAQAIEIDGFTMDSDGRAWTADGRWGLAREEDGRLTLLDSEGHPSNERLSDGQAAHIVERAGTGEELMNRWDYYASAVRS